MLANNDRHCSDLMAGVEDYLCLAFGFVLCIAVIVASVCGEEIGIASISEVV